MKRGRLEQQMDEYRAYFEFVCSYFAAREIARPMVVELGVWQQVQRRFYEKFMGADYLAIDISDVKSKPDILGDSRDVRTKEALIEKLAGRPIDLLFIDGDHSYPTVKSDWQMYGPLAKHIVAFHDIDGQEGVRRLWHEIRLIDWDHTHMEIHRYDTPIMGIGMVLK